MFKHLLLVVVALTLMASRACADDDLIKEVASLKVSSITDASISIDEGGIQGLDVDALARDAGGKKSEDAIEACFRRCGYGGYGGGYSCYNYGCYNYCYTPYYCYRPVCYYSSCYPTYSCYWGCY